MRSRGIVNGTEMAQWAAAMKGVNIRPMKNEKFQEANHIIMSILIGGVRGSSAFSDSVGRARTIKEKREGA